MSAYKDTIEDIKLIMNNIDKCKDINYLYSKLLPYINDEGYKHIIYNLIKYNIFENNSKNASKNILKILFLKLLASGEYITDNINICFLKKDILYEPVKGENFKLYENGTILKKYGVGDIIEFIDSETKKTCLTFETNYISHVAQTVISTIYRGDNNEIIIYNLPFILHFDEETIINEIDLLTLKYPSIGEFWNSKKYKAYLNTLLFDDEFKISDDDIHGYRFKKILSLLIYSPLRDKYKDLIKNYNFKEKTYNILYNIVENYDINIDIFKDVLKFLFDDDNIINIIEKSANEDKNKEYNTLYHDIMCGLLNNRYIEKYKTDKHKELILYIIDMFKNKVNESCRNIWCFSGYIINLTLYYEIITYIIKNKLNINLIPDFIYSILYNANIYTYEGIKMLNQLILTFNDNNIPIFPESRKYATEYINHIIKDYFRNPATNLISFIVMFNDLIKNNKQINKNKYLKKIKDIINKSEKKLQTLDYYLNDLKRYNNNFNENKYKYKIYFDKFIEDLNKV